MVILVFPLSVGFMDDIIIGGARSTVVSDVDQFRFERVKIGLHFNVAKCEVITKLHHQFDLEFQGFVNTHSDDACLLGAPFGSGRALDNTLTLRCSDLRIAIGRLKALQSHDALILLRSSFSAPKVMHAFCCEPCSGHPLLYEFDNLLREGISAITNSLLSNLQWQAFQSEREAWGFVVFHAGSFRHFGFCCEHDVSPEPLHAIGHVVS